VPVETFNYLDSLNVSNPPTSDGLVGGDDHIRGIKSTLKSTFPGLVGAATRVIGAAWGFLAGDGTASAPGYSFLSSPTTGIYLSSPGVMTAKGVLRSSIEVGEVRMFATAATPEGWVPCDGAAVPRTGTFSDLYAVIGTTWGTGDGSTTFNLPDLRDRYPRHRSASNAGAVGTKQSPTNMPHTHGVSGVTGNENQAHAHTFTGTTSSVNRNASHNHSGVAVSTVGYSSPGGATGVVQTVNFGLSGTTDTNHEHTYSGTTDTDNVHHNHTISLTSSGGSADGIETRPYSATLLFCIRY
jgi:microcystin-dependent protein